MLLSLLTLFKNLGGDGHFPDGGPPAGDTLHGHYVVRHVEVEEVGRGGVVAGLLAVAALSPTQGLLEQAQHFHIAFGMLLLFIEIT